MNRILFACVVLWGCFVFGIAHAEEEGIYEKLEKLMGLADAEEEDIFEEIEELRIAACWDMAVLIKGYLNDSSTQRLLVMKEIGQPFCKWCKDFDTDKYRAVCPR